MVLGARLVASVAIGENTYICTKSEKGKWTEREQEIVGQSRYASGLLHEVEVNTLCSKSAYMSLTGCEVFFWRQAFLVEVTSYQIRVRLTGLYAHVIVSYFRVYALG